MKLKVCGMRDERNITDLVETIKPDWMGLIFYPGSPRFVSSVHAASLRIMPIKKVGVFVNASLKLILDSVVAFDLQTIQLHGNESSEFAQLIKSQTNLEVFKVFSIGQTIAWEQMEAYVPHIDYFLFDTFTKAYGGSGKSFDWELLKEYPFDKPFLLSGGISPEHSIELLGLRGKLKQFEGIDINSKFEIKAAVKDVAMIEQFKAALKYKPTIE